MAAMMARAKSNLAKSNEMIRAAAGSLRGRSLAHHEDIVAETEEVLGWVLDEREQEIAVKEYARARSERLAEEGA
jgi:hypothetical protein